MNDLNALVTELGTLSLSYSNRVIANGPDHADNDYLLRQAMRWYVAAEAVQDAINEAAARV